jgi:aspartyl-tRNA(Asn)/glutamyl-tRNA(Gln) amidotransferase subunit B
MALSGHAPDRIVKERGLVQVSDASQIETAVDKVMAANADEVQAYRSGKTKLFGFFVGQVMRETKGKANPQVVNEVLKSKLGT